MALRRADGFVRYAMAVQYNGGSFLGFSSQGCHENAILPDGTDLRGYRTVESCLSESLECLVGLGNVENLRVSSRTDRGVHAMMNTFHVDVRRIRRGKGPPRRRRRRRRRIQQRSTERPTEISSSPSPVVRSDEDDDNDDEDDDDDDDDDDMPWDPITLARGMNHFLGQRQRLHWNSNSKSRYRHPPPRRRDVHVLRAAFAPSVMRNKFFGCAPEENNDEGEYNDEQHRSPRSVHEEFVDWSARFSATERTYVYRVYSVTGRDDFGIPFENEFSWRLESDQALDVGSMREAANVLTGELDFTSFRGSNCQRTSPITAVREISIRSQPCGVPDLRGGAHCGLLGLGGFGGITNTAAGMMPPPPRPRPELVTIKVVGKSFLYRQVRNMVGCLAEVGKGNIHAENVRDILSARDRSMAPATAPAHGLFLCDVQHGDFAI